MSLSFERSLTRVLRNWSDKQKPVIGVRAQILRQANELKVEAAKSRYVVSEYKGSSHHLRASQLFSLLYAPHMTLVSTWINF
jgi:hypothetical protein